MGKSLDALKIKKGWKVCQKKCWHTCEDKVVPCENSLMFAAALRKFNIPFELHIYQKGGHGQGLSGGHPWASEVLRWMETLNLAPDKKR